MRMLPRLNSPKRQRGDVLLRVAANARKAWERSYTLARYQERITAVMESLVSASQAERETRTLPARR